MARTVLLDQTGGPERMALVTVDDAPPGPDEVRIDQAAMGVNVMDVMQRGGAVPLPLPGGLGLEAAGRITAVGAKVGGLMVGDRVAYALGPVGAYADSRLYPADRLVRLPDAISFEAASATLFKGLTAQYLMTSTFPVGSGTVILLYGAAGALGQILAPWAASLGARVIGVVSREASVPRALAAGCEAVLVWGRDDLPQAVSRLTDGRKADVVYDGVGRETFSTSLDCLRPRGLMVSMGASSGQPAPVEVATLNARGSLFLTRPSLLAHTATGEEYQARAQAVLGVMSSSVVRTTPWKTFALADVAEAHRVLEHGGGTQGPIILIP